MLLLLFVFDSIYFSFYFIIRNEKVEFLDALDNTLRTSMKKSQVQSKEAKQVKWFCFCNQHRIHEYFHPYYTGISVWNIE